MPVRVRAALAIQKIDPKNVSFVPVLAGAMRSGDGRVLLAVGAMGAEAAWAVPTLVGLLSHESAQMRALAAQTLGRIGPAASEAKAALQRTLRDSNVAVQDARRGMRWNVFSDNPPALMGNGGTSAPTGFGICVRELPRGRSICTAVTPSAAPGTVSRLAGRGRRRPGRGCRRPAWPRRFRAGFATPACRRCGRCSGPRAGGRGT